MLLKARKFIPLLVVAAGLLAYHNSFTGEFICDDVGSIPDNPTIRHLWPIWQCLPPPHQDQLTTEGWLTVEGRPFINVSLAINYALGSLHVWGYHALNLTVHILAGLTLLGIVRRTLLQPSLCERFGAAADELALATAVLWTVHPLQTESVSYIIQRAESLMGLFYLLTLYCFIRGAESPLGAGSTRDKPPARLWYGLCLGACALGMASKEVMVTAPLMVMLYDRAFLSGSFREVWRRRWPLYVALASTWILLGLVLVSAGIFAYASMVAQRIHLTRWEYLATEPGVILYYLRLAVWPHPLCFDFYEWPIARTWMSILPPAVVVVILLGASAWVWRRNPVWGFVGAWFFLILAPTSSVIPLHDVIREHRLYLPLAAVVSVVVMGLYSEVGRRSMAVFVAAAIGLGFLTWRRNQDYRSDITIRVDAVAKFPNDPALQFHLGLALQTAGRIQEAIAHYKHALRIKPDYVYAHNNLGIALAQVGKAQEAIGQYEQALRIAPNYAEGRNNLAWQLATLTAAEGGDPSRAVTLAQQVCEITSNRSAAYLDTLAVAYAAAGRFSDAIATSQKAIELAGTAGQPELVKEIEARLELYRAGRAYRQVRPPVRTQSLNAASSHSQ